MHFHIPLKIVHEPLIVPDKQCVHKNIDTSNTYPDTEGNHESLYFLFAQRRTLLSLYGFCRCCNTHFR